MEHNEGTHFDAKLPHSFVVFGSSGDLARKKIYPTLWWLFRDNLLPEHPFFVGYARSQLTVAELRAKCEPYMKVRAGEEERYEQFWRINAYVAGSYDQRRDFELLNQEMVQFERKHNKRGNRLFYLALPPSVFQPVTVNIKQACMSELGWSRVIIEKPFGRDAASSQELTDHLARLFTEKQLYRIDHYLGKEMVQNLMTIRFGNRIFMPTWNRSNIASVLITFKVCKFDSVFVLFSMTAVIIPLLINRALVVFRMHRSPSAPRAVAATSTTLGSFGTLCRTTCCRSCRWWRWRSRSVATRTTSATRR